MAADLAQDRRDLGRLIEFAPAKINLTLRVLGRRPDGFHVLESLVVFARTRDAVTLVPADDLALTTRGPTAAQAGDGDDNLVLKAARALTASVAGMRHGQFTLVKRLPVAAGMGGGSSDAAAALRLLARVNGLALHDGRLAAAAAATGSDVPVCLAGRARIMRGRGEMLSRPIELPPIPALLVNPGIAVGTREVFAALAGRYCGVDGDPATTFVEQPAPLMPKLDALIAALARSRNDLEEPAIALCPAIAGVLSALRALPGCRLARMSGSGATCFALFDSAEAAGAARRALDTTHPGWWTRATLLR